MNYSVVLLFLFLSFLFLTVVALFYLFALYFDRVKGLYKFVVTTIAFKFCILLYSKGMFLDFRGIMF
jgi:hypothetical protein